MNIFLTGGTGYIGSHTALCLAESGYNVTLFDNLFNSDSKVVESLTKIVGKSINFIEGDVRDTKLLSKALKQNNVDAVIHFAGLKSVSESVKNPIDYFSTNVHGSISLIQAMKQNNIKKLVFSSSATVYGIPQYLPYDENHPTNPINPYGRSKLYVEEMLRDLSVSDPSWSIAVLRYFNPIGAHESAMIGELPSGTPNNLMPYILQAASGEIPVLNIFGDDYSTRDGSGERDYIHVMDLAEGHLSALKFISHQGGWHAFNIGTGNSTTVLELVYEFEKICHQKIPTQISQRRPGDLPVYYAEPVKARELLGWVAKRSIADMCLSSWRWKKSRSL